VLWIQEAPVTDTVPAVKPPKLTVAPPLVIVTALNMKVDDVTVTKAHVQNPVPRINDDASTMKAIADVVPVVLEPRAKDIGASNDDPVIITFSLVTVPSSKRRISPPLVTLGHPVNANVIVSTEPLNMNI